MRDGERAGGMKARRPKRAGDEVLAKLFNRHLRVNCLRQFNRLPYRLFAVQDEHYLSLSFSVVMFDY